MRYSGRRFPVPVLDDPLTGIRQEDRVTLTPAQSRALYVAARRVIQWHDRDDMLLEALAEIPAVEERYFDEDRDIYEPLRAALAACGYVR